MNGISKSISIDGPGIRVIHYVRSTRAAEAILTNPESRNSFKQ